MKTIPSKAQQNSPGGQLFAKMGFIQSFETIMANPG